MPIQVLYMLKLCQTIKLREVIMISEDELRELDLPEPTEYSVRYIGTGGLDTEEEYLWTCAKVVTESSNDYTGYYIKRGRGGVLFDPYDLTDFEAGKPYWMYVKVKEDVYKLYLRFLQTRSKKYLRHAERLM